MGNLGAPELMLILGIVVILFGAGKIPQLGQSLGEGIRNFKQGIRAGEEPAAATKEDASAAKRG